MKRSTFASVALLAALLFFACSVSVSAQVRRIRFTPKERQELRSGRREIRGDTRDLRGDRREILGDRRDLRGDVRDYRQDRREGASPKELFLDRQEIRSDRHELRNDHRELRIDRRDRRADIRDYRRDRRYYPSLRLNPIWVQASQFLLEHEVREPADHGVSRLRAREAYPQFPQAQHNYLPS